MRKSRQAASRRSQSSWNHFRGSRRPGAHWIVAPVASAPKRTFARMSRSPEAGMASDPPERCDHLPRARLRVALDLVLPEGEHLRPRRPERRAVPVVGEALPGEAVRGEPVVLRGPVRPRVLLAAVPGAAVDIAGDRVRHDVPEVEV